jgi:electron transfer flavoprotein alpha subunit
VNIVVCVKQVPAPAEVRFDGTTKTLVREGVPLVISSIDRRALLTALRLREEVGGDVIVLTMGPPQAQSALRECLALGADRAVHLSDPAFAGADTLATAQALAQAMRKLVPDLIVCGKFTIDSETGQVPSEVAELLDMPQVTAIRKLRPTESPDTIWVERETDDGHEQYHVTLPALISVTELVISTRRPTPEEMEAVAERPIDTWSAADLGQDPSLYGTAGSPTWVADLRSAHLERSGHVVSGEVPEEAVGQLVAYLVESGLFQRRLHEEERLPRRPKPASVDHDRAIWVFAELMEGRLRGVTHELLGRAQELADQIGGEVAALLVGGPSVKDQAKALGAYGADTVYVAADERLSRYDTEAYTRLITAAVREHEPHMLLFPATTNGRDLAPRLAARLQVGLTGDCVALESDSDGQVAQIKPAFGGNIVSPIYSSTLPIIATVRPGMLTAHKPDHTVQPQVLPMPPLQDTPSRVQLLEAVVESDLGATALDDADVVVTVGQGLSGPEDLPAVRDLVEMLDGALASTLRVAALGWLPPQLQLGLTGRTVAPRFYFAVAVSGSPNHLVGARKAEHIIAINNDPEAPIFKSANFGIVGDWAEVVPALTRALAAAKKVSSVGSPA